MKNFIFLLILFSVLIFFAAPAVSHASIVPCGLSQDDPNTPNTNESQMCTLCHFVIGIQGLIDYGFKIMVFVALAMLVYAGVVYIISAGSSGMMETAKHLLKNVLIGFSVILAAWLIVNTVMWQMGAKEAGDEGGVLGIQVNSWNNFTCKIKTK
ncbi:MAG: pilin [Patescibacteria group bacterium]